MMKRFQVISLCVVAGLILITLLGVFRKEVLSFAEERGISEEVRAAIAIQNRHTDRLLKTKGVVGTATGLTPEGKPAIKVYAKGTDVVDLPKNLEGLPVIVEITGEIIPLQKVSGKDRFNRPVPIGVSVGNINECSSGTIGCAVEKGGERYILSNNHVLARENKSKTGEEIVQPGIFDNKPPCVKKSQDKIGELSDFEPVNFSSSANNVMDAAIALSSTNHLSCSTFTSPYGFPSSTTLEATLDMPVQKVGRTTGYTTGMVTGLNATILVDFHGVATRFVDQIEVSGGGFLKSGDSGSLMVTQDENRNPVGLLFAGNKRGTIAFANRIVPVLNRFGVTLCSQ